MNDTPQRHFLGTGEVATILGVNVVTVRHMIQRGELPAMRLGSHIIRVRATDLDAYINAAAVQPRQTTEEK